MELETKVLETSSLIDTQYSTFHLTVIPAACFLCLSLCLCVYLSFVLYLSVDLPVFHSIHLSSCLSKCSENSAHLPLPGVIK